MVHLGRIESRSQKIQRDLERIGRDLRGVGVVGGERVQIGDEEVTVKLVLQLDPVGQSAHVVAQMQLSCGAHAAEDARAG